MEQITQKYNFDKSFDAESLHAAELARLKEEAEGPAIYTEKSHQEALAAVKATSYEEGLQEGKRQAQINFESQIQPLLEIINQKIDSLSHFYQEYFTANFTLAAKALHKVFPNFIENYDVKNLEAAISKAANLTLSKKIILEIHAHPSAIEKIKPFAEKQIKNQTLSWFEEKAFSPSQIEVKWEQTGLEQNSEKALIQFLEKLNNELNHTQQISKGEKINDKS